MCTDRFSFLLSSHVFLVACKMYAVQRKIGDARSAASDAPWVQSERLSSCPHIGAVACKYLVEMSVWRVVCADDMSKVSGEVGGQRGRQKGEGNDVMVCLPRSPLWIVCVYALGERGGRRSS